MGLYKGKRMITLYGYKKCSTCRNAEKNLESRGIQYTFVDITTTSPDADELKSIQKLAGVATTKLFNTSGVVYREQNIKEKIKAMNESELFALLASEGRLIKRPLVTDGVSATVGFSADTFSEVWK